MGSKALAISGLAKLAYARSKGPLRVAGLLMGGGYGDWRAGGRPSASRSIPRNAKVTPPDKIKLDCDRITCGLIATRVRRGSESSQARASGAAFKSRRDAPSLYDQQEREIRNLKYTEHLCHRNLHRWGVDASNSERRQSDSQLRPKSATKRPQLPTIYLSARVASRNGSGFKP